MENDFVSLADAATRLGVTVRQCQRLARRLSDDDRRIRDHGATFVRWEAFRGLAAHRAVADDTGREGRPANSEMIAKVATLESEITAARSEVARLQSELDRAAARESRHLEIMDHMAQGKHLPEQRTVRLIQEPPQETPQEDTERPQTGFWARLWGRG